MEALKNLIRSSYYGMATMPGIKWLSRPWRGKGAILCYHRVLPGEQVRADVSPNKGLAVSAERFEEQMRHLSENYNVVSMDRMVEHVMNGGKEFLVAVTFDDGYKDNYQYAYPILKKYRIPATIYVITRFLEGDTSMWWKELWERLAEAEEFEVEVRGERRTWRADSHSAKMQCFKEMRKILLGSEKEAYLDLVHRISGGAPKQYPDECMTLEEIRLLDKDELITIGAHTHSHFCLASLSENEVVEEMMKSREILEGALSRPVAHFAYPYGRAHEVGKMASMLAGECGFVSAVTTDCGTMDGSCDPMGLKRLSVHDYICRKRMTALMDGFASLVGRCL